MSDMQVMIYNAGLMFFPAIALVIGMRIGRERAEKKHLAVTLPAQLRRHRLSQADLEQAIARNFNSAVSDAMHDLLKARIAHMRETLAVPSEVADAEVERIMRDEDERKRVMSFDVSLREDMASMESYYVQLVRLELPSQRIVLQWDPERSAFI